MSEFIRAEEDDPLRCQGVGKSGQCPFLSYKGMVEYGHIDGQGGRFEDSVMCGRHGGESQAKATDRKRLHDYRLGQWEERVTEFSESEKTKTLRGEIGVLRLVLETTLNECRDPQQLMIFSSRISQLVQNIEKLVRSCDRLENTMGMMLDKTAALSFAGRIVDIVAAHVDDPAIIDSIADGIITALDETSKGDN